MGCSVLRSSPFVLDLPDNLGNGFGLATERPFHRPLLDIRGWSMNLGASLILTCLCSTSCLSPGTAGPSSEPTLPAWATNPALIPNSLAAIGRCKTFEESCKIAPFPSHTSAVGRGPWTRTAGRLLLASCFHQGPCHVLGRDVNGSISSSRKPYRGSTPALPQARCRCRPSMTSPGQAAMGSISRYSAMILARRLKVSLDIPGTSRAKSLWEYSCCGFVRGSPRY